MRVLAIDPSINYLGWVVMDPGVVVAYGTVNAEHMRAAAFEVRLAWMLDALNDVVADFDFDIVAIEKPEPWGSYKTMASDRSGSMQMLTLIVGALTYWAVTKVGVENVKLIKVSQHKGQLPKAVTKSRMERKYNCEFKTDHEADACSVGNYVLERSVNGTEET